MKSCLVFYFLILLFTFSAYGQKSKKDGLLLTGTIIDLKAVAECSGTDGRILVRVGLAMQFRNDSDRRFVVLKPNPTMFDPFSGDLGVMRVDLLESLPSATDKRTEWIQAINTRTDNCRPSNYTPYGKEYILSSFIRLIDLPDPPAEYFEVIEPGGYYTFGKSVTLDTGFEIDVKLGRSLREARILSEFPAFQIEYRLSLKGNEKGEGLFRTLQTRWKNYGDLVLDDNGDFTVTSEPIINRTTG